MGSRKHNEKSREKSLAEKYNAIMTGSSDSVTKFSTWEKVGDVFKQFSLYDDSKYETYVTSQIM